MRNKYVQLGLLGAMMLSSCSKSFLDQTNPNAVSVSQFFNNENDVLLALNGVYSSIRSSDNIGEESDLYSDQRSDDTGTNETSASAGEPFQFDNYALVSTNSFVKAHWSSLYQTITRANLVLANISSVKFSSDTTKSQYKAESEALRAVMYFHLVRKWGAIPVVTTPLTTADQVNAVTFRVPVKQVYAQITADLVDAANSSLPVTQSAAGRGRISKQAVNALLGQVYLTMASALDATSKATYLDSAQYYLLNCYNQRTFSKLSDIPYADVFDVNKKATCPELIWQIVNIQGDVNYHSNVAADNQAIGETINSLKTATATDGKVRHDLINEYETGDLRKDFSVKYAANASIADYFITKFRDASSTAGVNGYGGNDWPLIRYADVILMLSETYMLKGDNTSAIQYLDMVRARADMPTYEVSSTTDATYQTRFPTLKLAILHERRVELAFEHQRLFDLLRYFTADELVTYMHAKNVNDFGAALITNFSKKDVYFPIPYSEVILNPTGMYQNDDYK